MSSSPTHTSESQVDQKDHSSTSSDHEVSPPEFVDGGRDGWMTLLGAWFILFGTFGYLYAFGVYQDYYTRFFLSNSSPSKIAWIGSFQLAMPFLLGIVSGKLFDAGYFHFAVILGSCIFTACLFLLSLTKPQRYFEVFLSQGVGMGIGAGLTFIATVSISVHHFRRRKALATGIVMSGSSIGAVIYPIMINKLLPKIGFAQTVRASGYSVLGCLLIGNCLMRTAYDKYRNAGKPPLDIKSIVSDVPYLTSTFGALIALFGFYFPLIYIQLYAATHGIDSNLAFYSIAIVNASGAFGRLLGNFMADIYGVYTVVIPCTVITAVSIFTIFAIKTSGSLIAVSIFYGFFSGGWLSLSVSAISSLARHPSEVGARTGLAFALTSFGTLGAAPVQGALLTSNFNWKVPIIFSGVFMCIAAAVFALTRQILVKERKTQKV
ncbi:MFS general substrate transporter [Agrocybe pediades]|nr:MFS general substrate transporter [Agrocybe pediades]